MYGIPSLSDENKLANLSVMRYGEINAAESHQAENYGVFKVKYFEINAENSDLIVHIRR